MAAYARRSPGPEGLGESHVRVVVFHASLLGDTEPCILCVGTHLLRDIQGLRGLLLEEPSRPSSPPSPTRGRKTYAATEQFTPKEGRQSRMHNRGGFASGFRLSAGRCLPSGPSSSSQG